MNRSILALAFLALTFPSCDSEIPTRAPKTLPKIFEEFWTNMNRNYVYWDIDTTDWDNIYHQYRPKFNSLDRSRPEDLQLAVRYFDEMSRGLIDGHFSINFSPEEITHHVVNPLYERKKKLDTLYNFSYLPYDTVYLDQGYRLASVVTESEIHSPLVVLSGTIGNDVIYFGVNRFELTRLYHDNEDVAHAIDYFFDLLAGNGGDYAGIIIDVRNNPGGDLVDLNFILRRMIDEPLLFGYTQYKRGYGRLEYTDWVEAYVMPQSDQSGLDVPVVVLADRNSGSLAESVVMTVQAMPDGLFVGETTWGATGPVIEHDAYVGGSFNVGDFMKVKLSTCKMKSIEHAIYEGIGIPPNVQVSHSFENYATGIDAQLEAALEIIRGQ